jgi:hypothetical protein
MNHGKTTTQGKRHTLARDDFAGALLCLVLLCLWASVVSIRAAEWSYLDNGEVKLGVRKDLGATICYFAPSGSGRNLLNHWDTGRCVQQSYYGEKDGSMWDRQPWRWNPVQGGHYKGEPAKVLAFDAKAGGLYTKTMPKHWASGADIPEMTMEQWIELRGKSAHIRFKMTYSGGTSHPKAHQETPAIFADPDLDTLVYYRGDKPWTGAAVASVVPGWPNESHELGEHWAAYVDGSGSGVGFYSPIAKATTAYRFLAKNAPREASCSYIAPLQNFAITPGFSFEYEITLLAGTAAEIRDAAYKLHAAPKP